MTEEDLKRIKKLMHKRDLYSGLRHFDPRHDKGYNQILLDLADEVPLLVNAVETLLDEVEECEPPELTEEEQGDYERLRAMRLSEDDG